MNKKVIIIGASGHGKSIGNIMIHAKDEIIGFLDDNIPIGTEIIHSPQIKVIGTLKNIDDFPDVEFVIGVGSNQIRKEIASQYSLNYYKAIHPSAQIGVDTQIGMGTVIMANACVNACATIGSHCIINTGAIVEHENHIGDFVHISPNAALAGNVKIGNGTHIGIGAIVKNNVTITDDVVIGAGSVVVKDIKESGTYIGVPARRLK